MEVKINKFIKVILLLCMFSAAYAMEKDEGDLNHALTLRPPMGTQQENQSDILTRLNSITRRKVGGSILNAFGLGEQPVEYISLEEVTALVLAIGRENAHLMQQLSQTSQKLQESSAVFENAAAVQRALEEQQVRADKSEQDLNRLKLHYQALELKLEEEKEKTQSLLIAKNTAERDLLLKQKRAETLESLNEEKTRIIEQLQHVQQEKDKLLESKKLLENLLRRKLNLDSSREEISPEELEKLIEAQETCAKEELRSLRNLIEEEKRKEFKLQQQIERLAEEQVKNEERIKVLTHTIYLSENPYEYLERLINLPAAEFSDENLACEIMLVVHREKKDLDELTPSGKKRLIEVLIDRTRPYQRTYDDHNRRRSDKIIPGGENDRAYKGRDRELGNVFIKGGFGFGGSPVDMNACRYKGSQFERNATSFISSIK